MSAVAIFSCRQNSHPFQERHISLHEPVKIGRSVARARSSPSNGTFDCKVLSRNHAMLWYSNGKFHLQDTKSSNGTFVNNQRLSKGSEESAPREIFSGDLIQFGVEVMENNRRGEKITHGCIIATVTLFHPDGREAKPVYPNSSSYLSLPSQPGVTIQSQELYQLAHYLQEALHREQMLEQKLVALQELVQRTQEASENGWQALIDEDRLLSRLEVLESQLNTYSKNYAEDTLRQELVALQEDKHNYETTAKESLRRVLQEKLEAVRKISDLERSLGNAESECCHLKEMCEVTQDELQILAEKYQDQIKEVQELQEKLQEAENIHQEEMEKVEQEKQELTEKIEEMTKEEKILSAKVESLQADNDISKEQLTAMKSKLANSKELEDDNRIIHLDGGQVDIIPLSQKDEAPKDLQEKLHETQEQIGNYKAKIEELELQLKESSSKVEQLQRELEIANEDSEKCYEKITILEEKLKLSDLHMNQMMENAMADLRLQLKEAQRQTDCSTELNKQLEEQIESLEKDLASYKIPHSKLMTSESSDTTAPKVSSPQSVCNHMDSRPAATKSQKSSEVDKLKELLQKARHEQKRTEQELLKCKEELEVARKKSEKSAKELIGNKEKLFDSQIQAKERMETINDLQEQLKKAEASTKDVKEQILNLRDSLLEEQEQSHIKQVEAEKLRNLLDREKTKQKEAQVELHGTKRQLQEAQQSAKQNRNEAEQLRNKVKHLHEELELLEKSPKTRDIHHSKHTAHQELHRTPPRNKSELIALKEECTNLRKRIQAIEAEMKLSRKENLQLSSDYNKLQESYRELEALKQKLEHKEILWKSNMTDAQKEAQQAKEELSKATDGISDLKSKCEKCSEQVGNLQGELTDVLDEYRNLRDKSKLLSFISSIPLLMLLFALLLALYPTLEDITATSSLS